MLKKANGKSQMLSGRETLSVVFSLLETIKKNRLGWSVAGLLERDGVLAWN